MLTKKDLLKIFLVYVAADFFLATQIRSSKGELHKLLHKVSSGLEKVQEKLNDDIDKDKPDEQI